MDKEILKSRKRILCDDNVLISKNKSFKEDINMKYSINLSKKSFKSQYATNDCFVLPINYTNILNNFISLDLVVNKLLSNHEVPYIDRINKLLKEMNKSNFDENVFGQILSIFPESYQYEFDKTPEKFTRRNFNRFQILPNLKFGLAIDSSPRKSSKSLSLSQLLLRKSTFKERLIMLVKKKHDEFLINVKKLKAEDVEEMKVLRWASDFNLNDVEPIVAIKLDKNNKFAVNSPLPISLSKTKRIEVEQSTVCKDLFGDLIATKNGKEKKITKQPPVKIEANLFEKADYKSNIKDLNQSQLSFGFNERKSKSDTKLIKSPKIVHSPKKDFYAVQKQRLPFHLKSLLELFVNVDKTVHSLFMRGEMQYLSRILKSVSITKTYDESHFGQLLTVYPDAYKLRWEQVMNKQTNKLSNKLDIVVTPQLRTDCTQVSLSSPDKGFIKFDIVRLTQRQQRFLDLCVDIVERDRVAHSKMSNGNVEFNVDLHVAMIDVSPLPVKPTGKDAEKAVRIRSIADMFSMMKRRHEVETKDVTMKDELVCERLKSVPQSILDRVRQNKEQRSLLTTGVDVGDKNHNHRMILERLPQVAMAVTREILRHGGGPVPRSVVARAVCGDVGIDDATFEDHLAMLVDLCPGMVHTLPYNPPCLVLGTGVTRDELVRRAHTRLAMHTST